MFESLKIYPNPTKDFINIEMLNNNLRDYTFSITDMNGKQLLKSENSKKIDVSKLSPGMYFGTLNVEGQTLSLIHI